MPITKSHFLTGSRCEKLLWWNIHEPNSPELSPSITAQLMFEQGRNAGIKARESFLGGITIRPAFDNQENAILATRDAIENGATTIFEAAVGNSEIFAAIDVLESNGPGWTLVEVKASSKCDKEHITEMAFLLLAARQSGLDIIKAELMHLNSEARFPCDVNDLFVREDITDQALAQVDAVATNVNHLAEMLNGSIPNGEYGSHCKQDNGCCFFKKCWDFSHDHVSRLYRVRADKANKYMSDGITKITDVPDKEKLTPIQSRQKRAIAENALVVDPGLQIELAKLNFPIAMLDFETISLAIPVWDGCKPNQAIPVQFSCHVVYEDGRVVAHAWLADGPGDPRTELITHLLRACDGVGTIAAYNASFEKTCMKELGASMPEYSAQLDALIEKVADLMPPIQNNVYHPNFAGSFSLKKILPVLVDDMAYDDLAIQEGMAASDILMRLIFKRETLTDSEVQSHRAALLSYCGRDTEAMVELFNTLKRI